MQNDIIMYDNITWKFCNSYFFLSDCVFLDIF